VILGQIVEILQRRAPEDHVDFAGVTTVSFLDISGGIAQDQVSEAVAVDVPDGDRIEVCEKILGVRAEDRDVLVEVGDIEHERLGRPDQPPPHKSHKEQRASESPHGKPPSQISIAQSKELIASLGSIIPNARRSCM
jgi:hypothetical protein